MASPGNRHCANCIGTLSFPVVRESRVRLPALRFQVSTLGKFFTHACASVSKKYNLVPVKGGDALRLQK